MRGMSNEVFNECMLTYCREKEKYCVCIAWKLFFRYYVHWGRVIKKIINKIF